MSQVYDYSFLFFCLVCLESIIRWRLSVINIQLELELFDLLLAFDLDMFIMLYHNVIYIFIFV